MNDNNIIKVAEMFGPTIQGEGPNVGAKCIFVRVANCDFRCEWCDSSFAWNDNCATKYTENELLKELVFKCNTTNTSRIILTGGNPCIYDFTNVINALHEYGISVDVETQGSILPEWLKQVDQIVISPKAPSSHQKDVFDKVKTFIEENKELQIAIKIPIFDQLDFDFAMKYYEAIESINNDTIKLYLSVGNADTKDPGDISARVLRDYNVLIDKACNSKMKNVYILPQVHTLV